MKRIVLLTLFLMVMAVGLFSTAHTVGAFSTTYFENRVWYTNTTAFTDSTTEQIGYIDTPVIDGHTLSGKKVRVSYTITTNVTQGSGNGITTARLSPCLYASTDGVTYVLAKEIKEGVSSALTTGTVTSFVIDCTGMRAPYYKIYYRGVGAAAYTYQSPAAFYGGKVITTISVISAQKQ